MDNYRQAIADCCKQLRLSVNLVENAMVQTGESHQEYLYNLLKDEIRYRAETRISKLVNTAGFPVSHSFSSFHPGEVQFPAGVTIQSLQVLNFYQAEVVPVLEKPCYPFVLEWKPVRKGFL